MIEGSLVGSLLGASDGFRLCDGAADGNRLGNVVGASDGC